MTPSTDFRRCLVDCDIAGIRKLWADVAPNLPQPADDLEALAVIHLARTEARSIDLRLRAYSHRWLLDLGYPSSLPDSLRPKAERMYPVVVGGVGIAALAPKPHTPIVQGVMRDAVMEAYADDETDPVFVRERMMAARAKELKKLFG